MTAAVADGVAVVGFTVTVAGSGAGRAGSWDFVPDLVRTTYGSTRPLASFAIRAIANRGVMPAIAVPASSLTVYVTDTLWVAFTVAPVTWIFSPGPLLVVGTKSAPGSPWSPLGP